MPKPSWLTKGGDKTKDGDDPPMTKKIKAKTKGAFTGRSKQFTRKGK